MEEQPHPRGPMLDQLPEVSLTKQSHPASVVPPLDPPVRSRDGSPAQHGGRSLAERSDSLEVLERLVNTASLSTQRVTHLNILAIGDELLTSKKRRRRKQDVAAPAGPVPMEIAEEESDEEDADRLEKELAAAQTLAEKEKQRALKAQEESFTKMLEEVARNRDHLEVERLGQFRRKLEREQAEALKTQRMGFEAQKQEAVKAACTELRNQVRREVEQECSWKIESALAAAKVKFQKQLEAAVQVAQAECRTQADEERSRVLGCHAREIQKLQDEMAGLRHEIALLHREKKAYEWQYQEVQLNYRRFIDLTESGLHSDYLLRLRRLGLPPGHTDTGVQTDHVSGK
ncbi:uncharacterized abhydrolase domain-containing protein DDB_G0269086-like [Ambystoma mexicanum]|uniref:uncharacterized abhydrolase domain-containing protein DDB_G0269086-like n=1 Tax=Ambystoma mexicanum TaxID=8296 RepID=UPI0037E8DEA1